MQKDSSIIFVGLKINDKLREQLDSSRASMKPFFANNDPKYLQVMQIDAEDYLAKTAESGVSLEDIKNMAMNLKTMLNMICPNFNFSEDAIKIYAHTPIQMRSSY